MRLVNTADGVPDTPNSVAPKPNKVYEHVGRQIDFTADYSDGGKNHNPCCTYSYALHNPSNPVNPDLACDFPQDQLDDNSLLPEYEVEHTDNPRKTRIFVLRTY